MIWNNVNSYVYNRCLYRVKKQHLLNGNIHPTQKSKFECDGAENAPATILNLWSLQHLPQDTTWMWFELYEFLCSQLLNGNMFGTGQNSIFTIFHKPTKFLKFKPMSSNSIIWYHTQKYTRQLRVIITTLYVQQAQSVFGNKPINSNIGIIL